MPTTKRKKKVYITAEVVQVRHMGTVLEAFRSTATHFSLAAAEREVAEERTHSGNILAIFERVPQTRSGRAK